MPTRYDPDDDDREDLRQTDREISLGTGTILGIFLALALVCSLFFGLGYSMGRKSIPAIPLASSASPPSSLVTSDESKPAPGSAEPLPASPLQVVQPLDPASSDSPTTSSASPHPHRSIPPPDPAPALPVPSTGVPPAPQIFVQIAAVSRREDADTLLSALTQRGYTGLVRQAPQDKLLHVQVGPFPSKKDAELMRQRLIVDGYNPILK